MARWISRVALGALVLLALGLPAAATAQQLPQQVVLGNVDINAPLAGAYSCGGCPTSPALLDSRAPVVPFAGLITQLQAVVQGPGSLRLVPLSDSSSYPSLPPGGTG